MKNLLIFLISGVAFAQQLDLSGLDKLSSKATESSTVTLDAAKLKMASQFLSSSDPGQEKAKSLITGLRAIFVRTFEFDKSGGYSSADLEPIRKQLTAPGWSNIVDVKSRDMNTELWLFSKGDVLDGMTVIAAAPNEVTVVNIVGAVDINALSKLSGNFGIPKIDANKPATKPAQPKKDDEDEE